MMDKIIVILIAVVLGTGSLTAQNNAKLSEVEFSSAQLDSLIQSYVRANNDMQSLDGYRIQLLSRSGSTAKSEAQQIKQKFSAAFPLEKIYVVYNAPFWRVKVGDFRFRSEALPLLEKIKRQFPEAYAVRDNTVRKRSFNK